MAVCAACDSAWIMHVSVISVFAFLALVAVIFRLWARKIQSLRLELNDYFCIGGLVFAIASTILSVQSYVYWGFFSPSVPEDPKTMIIQFKALFAAQLLWIVAVTLIRASVIFLYIRIFCTKPFRIACHVVLAINLAYFTATVLAVCLICRPFAYNWDRSIQGSCGDSKSMDLFIGAVNLLMDVTTVVLPLPVLWGLQMRAGRKLALSVLFSMGTAICIITLVRIKITNDITAQSVSSQYALIALLTCLESSLGVVNACLPVSKPVFDKLNPVSLIYALSGRGSTGKPSVPSRDLEMAHQPKGRNLRGRDSGESGVGLSGAVWSPPESPVKGF